MTVEEIIQAKKGTIVDVRTREEFAGGHVANSKNIPLQELENHIDELKNFESPLILCCASGGRSGMAQGSLSQAGIECYNAGSWMAVNGLCAE